MVTWQMCQKRVAEERATSALVKHPQLQSSVTRSSFSGSNLLVLAPSTAVQGPAGGGNMRNDKPVAADITGEYTSGWNY